LFKFLLVTSFWFPDGLQCAGSLVLSACTQSGNSQLQKKLFFKYVSKLSV
jgi:hypothetical protein